MAGNKITTAQGQAWDQVALDKYGNEKQMGVLPPANIEHADALLFSGGIALAVPEQKALTVKSLPPWERM